MRYPTRLRIIICIFISSLIYFVGLAQTVTASFYDAEGKLISIEVKEILSETDIGYTKHYLKSSIYIVVKTHNIGAIKKQRIKYYSVKYEPNSYTTYLDKEFEMVGSRGDSIYFEWGIDNYDGTDTKLGDSILHQNDYERFKVAAEEYYENRLEQIHTETYSFTDTSHILIEIRNITFDENWPTSYAIIEPKSKTISNGKFVYRNDSIIDSYIRMDNGKQTKAIVKDLYAKKGGKVYHSKPNKSENLIYTYYTEYKLRGKRVFAKGKTYSNEVLEYISIPPPRINTFFNKSDFLNRLLVDFSIGWDLPLGPIFIKSMDEYPLLKSSEVMNKVFHRELEFDNEKRIVKISEFQDARILQQIIFSYK